MRKAEILNVNRYNADKGYKVAADAALRAVIGCAIFRCLQINMNYGKFIFGLTQNSCSRVVPFFGH